MNTALLVTIDTEEEGLWSGEFQRTGNTVKNIEGVERFQLLCDRFGIRPTYLVDAPVVEEDRAAELFRGLQEDNRAEIGAHLHPWCNPPFDEEISNRNSFLCNLPADLQRAKLKWLTDSIEARIGQRPRSFRAGRYGLDIVGARLLAESGYLVDSSVIPFCDYTSREGPDFSSAPYRPYLVGDCDLRIPGRRGALLEVPVTVGFNRMNFERASALRRFAARRWLKPARLVGLLDRTSLVCQVKFSPEQASAERMICLTDIAIRKQLPSLVMMFHSSSLVPGHSPYVRDQRELDRFFLKLRMVFEHCICKRNLWPMTLSGFARRFTSGGRGDSSNGAASTGSGPSEGGASPQPQNVHAS